MANLLSSLRRCHVLVSQRARELGIRVALGASRSSRTSYRLVTGHGIRFILIGLAMGIAMAAGVTRLLSTMLFGLAATDAVTFGQVAVVVAAVNVACVVPAARAGRLVVSVLKAESNPAAAPTW